MSGGVDALWSDLEDAIGRDIASSARRARRRRVAALCALSLAAASSAAIASGVASDLDLVPEGWAVLRGGTVDGGRGAFAEAVRRADGASSTFLLEHDDGLAPYDAFLLHQRTLAAAADPGAPAGEACDLCTPVELSRAETLALSVLRAGFPPGTPADRTRPAVDAALARGFAGAPCAGLEYAGERARFVFAGVEPASKLMPTTP
jgi:hypothetical protein